MLQAWARWEKQAALCWLIGGYWGDWNVMCLTVQAFNLVNIIIDRLADEVKPYAEGLLQLLPAVWQVAEGQSLLRIQVPVVLTCTASPVPSTIDPTQPVGCFPVRFFQSCAG